MALIKFAAEQRISPLARDILKQAAVAVYGDEEVKMKKVPIGPGVLGFGVKGGILALSPKQICSVPNAISSLMQSFNLYRNGLPKKEFVYNVVETFADFQATLFWMEANGFDKPCCVDIENAPDRTLLSISVTYGQEIVVFPLEFMYGNHLKRLVEVLAGHYYIIGANWKHDAGVILDLTGIKIPVWFDTMLANHSLYPSATGQHALKSMAQRLLGVPDWDTALHKFTGTGKKADFRKAPPEMLYKYNAYDVFYTFQVYEYMLPLVAEHEPFWTEVYWANGFIDIESYRVRLDIDYVVALREQLLEIEAENLALLPEGMNPRSPKQILEYLHSKGVMVAGTDAKTLEEIKNDERVSDFVKPLLAYRKTMKQRGTYCDSYLEKEQDGFIRPTVNIHGTGSGRMSGSDPNCVDGLTEVLTPTGWLPIKDLQPGTPVLQVDEAGESSFSVPTEIHHVQAPNMVEIAADWGTFRYTPDHRVLSYTRDGRVVWDTAGDWLRKWEGEHIIDRRVRRGTHVVGGRTLRPDERKSLQLAVLVQAEGSLRDNKKDPGWYDVAVTGSRKRDQLNAVGGTKASGTRLRKRVEIAEVSMWLEPGPLKNFRADQILALSYEDLQWFISEVMLWDGDSTRGQTYAQTGGRKASVDVVQAAMALCGYSTTIYENSRNDLYVVNKHTKELRHQSRTVVQEVEGGDAYCVTVPTGAFLIRREGAVLVTGNCQNVPRDKKIRKCFIAREPGWVRIECDYAQAELRLQAILSGDPAMIAAFQPDSHDFFDLIIPQAFPHVFHTVEEYLDYEENMCDGDEKDYRAQLKGVVYGLNFGRGARAIGESLEMPTSEAQKIIDAFLATYPVYAQWRQEIMVAAVDPERADMLTGPYGLQYLAEVVTDANRGSLQRSALSFLPQNGVSFLCTTAAVRTNYRLRREGMQAMVNMVVHDAVYIDCPMSERDYAMQVVQEEMEKIGTETYGNVVLFAAEPAWFTRWGVKPEEEEV